MSKITGNRLKTVSRNVQMRWGMAQELHLELLRNYTWNGSRITSGMTQELPGMLDYTWNGSSITPEMAQELLVHLE